MSSLRVVALAGIMLFLAGCAGALNLPDSPRPSSYKVESGDTLYSIAWHYGLDYQVVAQWNGIEPPYKIFPGQHIKLYAGHASGHGSSTATNAQSERNNQAPTVARVKTYPAPARGFTDKHAQANAQAPQWRWPASGAVHNTFGQKGIAGKGIVITGKIGEPVQAAAGGTVVYAGDALVGYGRLIIVKHNDRWLSAYAHNQRLLAHEGQAVSVGQTIATMGRGPDGNPVLYFEIRKDGSPVNPLHYLSSRR